VPDFILAWLFDNITGTASLVVSFVLLTVYLIGQLRQSRAQKITAESDYIEAIGTSAQTIITSASMQVDLLQVRMASLEQQVRRLEDVVMQLQGENAILLEENRDLRRQINKLSAKNIQLQETIERLKARLATMETNAADQHQ
jgi:chromosome segregation ATPase